MYYLLLKQNTPRPVTKIFVAGTFSADIVLPAGGIYTERQTTNNRILPEQPEPQSESEPESVSEPEPEPEPVLDCKCGIELPKKLKIIGGSEVLRVGFSYKSNDSLHKCVLSTRYQ